MKMDTAHKIGTGDKLVIELTENNLQIFDPVTGDVI